MARPLATAIALAFLAALALAPPAAVLAFHDPDAPCACHHPALADLAREPGMAVFVARSIGPLSMSVDAWFQGPDPSRAIRLDPVGVGHDRARCQIDPLPPGSRWIVAAGRPIGADGSAPFLVTSCQRHARLGDPSGQAMLREAFAAFGDPAVLGEAVARPGPTTAPPPGRPPDGDARAPAGWLWPMLAMVVGILVLATVGAIGARGGRRPDAR